MKPQIEEMLNLAEVIKSFDSLLTDGSTVDTALLQIAFEEGCSLDEARQRLQRALGDLSTFAKRHEE